MRGHAVLIVGGGPTGLMLAGELALAGVDVAILERRATQAVVGQRAGGLHARTIEVLDQRGIAERFLSQGTLAQVVRFGIATVPLDISDFPTRHNYGLALWQGPIEQTLCDWVEELRVPIYREVEVTNVVQDDTRVVASFACGRSLEARYLVGCDGGRSLVRKLAGIDFPGVDAATSRLIAEADIPGDFPTGVHYGANGVHGLMRMENGTVRVMIAEPTVDREADAPTLRDLSEGLIAAFGSDFGLRGVTSISRFTDVTRQAASYRSGRLLLAGDAAHVHSPVGGQGLNIGVQDAVNLGWKLGQVVNGISPDSLLDTYHAERHPVGARVLHNTLAASVLLGGGERVAALRDIMAQLLPMDGPRKLLAGMLSGLDVHYDLGDGHPLLGRRMPDLDLGETRVYEALHAARPVVFHFGEPGAIDIAPWDTRVRLVDARYDGAWELPVIGAVPTPTSVLVRPDGHVAWVGMDHAQTGLVDALATWCGPPEA